MKSNSGTFSPTVSMMTVRANSSATLLPGGTVLVAGGDNNSIGLSFSSAELFDPGTGSFTQAADMTSVREAQTSTLLKNGAVLLAGGQKFTAAIQAQLASAELYQ